MAWSDAVEVISYPTLLLLEREVRVVVDAVECACGVGVEGGEVGAEVVLLGAALGDELEGAAVGTVVGEAVDEDPGDLVPGDDAIGRVACLVGVTLAHDDLQLVGIVVVEPSGPDDRVTVAAGPDEALASALPLGAGVPDTVAPTVVISAIRTERPLRACRTLRTAP